MDSGEVESGDEEEEEESEGEARVTKKGAHGRLRWRSGRYHRRRGGKSLGSRGGSRGEVGKQLKQRGQLQRGVEAPNSRNVSATLERRASKPLDEVRSKCSVAVPLRPTLRPTLRHKHTTISTRPQTGLSLGLFCFCFCYSLLLAATRCYLLLARRRRKWYWYPRACLYRQAKTDPGTQEPRLQLDCRGRSRNPKGRNSTKVISILYFHFGV